jgi:hypothetical protein
MFFSAGSPLWFLSRRQNSLCCFVTAASFIVAAIFFVVVALLPSSSSFACYTYASVNNSLFSFSFPKIYAESEKKNATEG